MKNRSRQNSLVELGEEPSDTKKRSQKVKRKNSTELFNEFRNEIDNESSFAKQRAYYENMQHLSGNERAIFDNKFTYRVSQKQSFNKYGYALNINKIVQLSTTDYLEELEFTIKPNFFNYLDGTHHIHGNSNVTVFDFAKKI